MEPLSRTASGRPASARPPIARVIIFPGDGTIVCNGRPVEQFFGRASLVTMAKSPLVVSGTDGRFSVWARLNGGGISGQAGALRHGIARALVAVDETLRPEIKKAGYLERDSRIVERKKAGLKKARKRPQFSKR